MDISLFYITTGSETEALELGNLAVEKHVAACANVFPIQSSYPWAGKMERESEFVLILKTITALEEDLRNFIRQHHTYAVPCIISWTVRVNDEYGKWVEETVKNEK